jgi:hypothetical protein
MKTKSKLIFLVSCLLMAINTFADIDNENHKIVLTPECETNTTGLNGARKRCTSNPSCQKVPDGFVINEKEVKKSFTSKQGSEYECSVSFDEYVEAIKGTGIKLPTKICGKAYALSAKGAGGVKGTAHCKIETYYVKIK